MKRMRIPARIALLAIGVCVVSCRANQEADVMKVYSYNDTLYALRPLDDDDLSLFDAPAAWPADTVVLEPALYGDSLIKRPLLVFHSSLQLPLPTHHKEIATTMNDTITYRALHGNIITADRQWPQVFVPHTAPDTLMRRLYQQLAPLLRDSMEPPNNGTHYYYGVNGNFSFFSDKVLSYCLHFEQYTLGAHGNYRTQYLVFDSKTGLPMQEHDIFVMTDENRAAITALLHRSFDEYLADAGVERDDMAWDEDAMVMNGNFAVEEDGIVYHYNVYEAGPYAYGALELKLLSYKLKPYLVENSPVYNLWFK